MGVYQKHNSLAKRTYNTVVYNDFRFYSHFHKNIEFVYIMDGEVTVTVDTRTETVKKGRFVIVPPMSVHSFDTPRYSKVWVGVFSNDYVSEFCSFISSRTSKKLSFKAHDTALAEKSIESLDGANDFEIKGFLYSVCGEYIKRCEFTETDVKKTDLFNKAMEYIANNYLNDITLESMASELNYEPHYLSRCFHEHTGENFRRLVNGYRIELAKELLTKGRMSVSEVAMQSGFKCIRNFNRVFKQMTDVEPKNYAESLNK